MIIYIITAVLTFLLVMFLFQFHDLAKHVSRTAITVNSILIDKSVDEICNKAVIIGEYMSHDTNLTEKQRQAKSLENACAIVADVLLQHGLNARDYNIEGLVTVAQHRACIIALSQYEEKSTLGS